MANPARGDVALEIAGAPCTLSFTLAALAEIETALGVDDLAALGGALKRLNASQLNLVLTALLRAGGAENAASLAAQAEPLAALKAVSTCFKANLS